MREGWTYKKLGEVCTVLNGLWVGKKEPLINIAVIRNTNFSKDCKLKLDDVAYIDVEERQFLTRKLQVGDIIIEKSGGSDKQPVGRPVLFNISDGDYSFSNFTSTLRLIDKTVNPKYLHKCLYGYYRNGETKRLQSKTTGLHNLDMKAYLRFPIPVPPLSEQQRIVNELDLLSSIIEKKKAQLKEYDQLAQSIFYDMFGDPVENPKGWEVKKLGEVGTIVTGNTPSTKDNRNYDSNDVCFFKPSDIEKDGISLLSESEFYVSSFAYNSARKLPKGCVLVTCIGIVGKVGILEIEATCNQQINAIVPNNQVNSNYVAFSILAKRRIIESIAHAPVVPIINKGTFSQLSIPVPPLPLQQSFASKIEAIERQKALIQQSITEAETLFNSRMDYYFN